MFILVKMFKELIVVKIVLRCIIFNVCLIVRFNVVFVLYVEFIVKNIDICFIFEIWLNKSINL